MFNPNTSLLAGAMTKEQLRNAIGLLSAEHSGGPSGADPAPAGTVGYCCPHLETSEVSILLSKVQILGPDGQLVRSLRPLML
jgi:hypothetical protein